MRTRLPLLALIPTFCCAVPAFGATHYVDLNSTNATLPFADWATAATNIQDAVDAAAAGDLVLVTNGVYATGGGVEYAARVSVTNALTLRSVNGPGVTVIDGGSTMRCAELTDGTVLSGFTLKNGYGVGQGGGVLCFSTNSSGSSALVESCLVVSNVATYQGGGVSFGIVSNCTLAYNFVFSIEGGGADLCTVYNSELSSNSAPWGGGCAWSTLNNCMALGNTGREGGGGAYISVLNNCLVVSNLGGMVGGAMGSDLTNCTVCGNSGGSVGGVGNGGPLPAYSLVKNSIVYYNSPSNWNYNTFITNTCTTPLSSGAGNFTNAPLFINLAAGDFHLASNSPCINAGNNAFVAGNTDYDGNPRVVGGTVDLGAYEFQLPSSILSYAWAQQYGLPTDGTADFADTDGDGLNNWQEWIAGTSPTNASSVLKMLSPSNSVTGATVSWQSVNTRTYFLQRATNLVGRPVFSALQSNLVGQAGKTVYTDTTATNGGPYFYRVGVQ